MFVHKALYTYQMHGIAIRLGADGAVVEQRACAIMFCVQVPPRDEITFHQKCHQCEVVSETAQNKCTRYCLQLGNRSHIGQNELLRINWLNVNDRVDQYASVQAFKCFNSTIPLYMNDVFSPAE